MNLNDNIWTEVAEYPFAPMLYEYSSVSLEESVVILGGYVNGGDGGIQSTIAEYKDGQWIRLGDLKKARYGHSSIYDGISILTIGGNDQKESEKFDVHEGPESSILTSPDLYYYYDYPEIFVLPQDFCQ